MGTVGRTVNGLPNTTPGHDAYSDATAHVRQVDPMRYVGCLGRWSATHAYAAGTWVVSTLGSHCTCWHVLSCSVFSSAVGYMIGRVVAAEHGVESLFD